MSEENDKLISEIAPVAQAASPAKKLKQTPKQKAAARASKEYRKRKRQKYDEAVVEFAEHQVKVKEEAINATKPLSDEEVRKVLINERGLSHPHVVDTVLEWGKMAAEANKLVSDRQYWINGFAQKDPSFTTISDEQANGMVISTRDLFALYDFGISWRTLRWPLDTFDEFRDLPWDFTGFVEKKGKSVTFQEFHGLRYCSIVDSYWSGRWIHAKDFWPKPHCEWRDFFVKKIPSLPMEYSTEDIKTWFKALTDGPRRFLLVASRNSYKSSWQVVSEAIPFVLAVPDVTILEISAIQKLSKKFIKSFRQYWTVSDKRKPNLFNMIWPEMMIYSGDKSDASVFDCPMKKGLYPQNTMASSSVDSSQVGERCLVLIFDDPADEENTAKEELRENLIEKIELIEKLKEPSGIEIIIGTPKAAVGDLYKTIIDRSAKTQHRHLDYVINPAWTLKPEAIGKNIHDIVESDVESLLFPSRMDFDFLKAELENGSEKTFRRENLCQWVDDDDPNLKLHFDRTCMDRNVINIEQVPTGGDVYVTGDLGFSLSKYRDPSSFTVHKTIEDTIYILLQSTGHWNDNGKAEEIVRIARNYPGVFNKCILEKYSANEGLDKEIQLIAMKYGTNVPVFWLPPTQDAEAKFRRLKHSVESSIFNGKVKFVRPKEGIGPNWIEDLFQELLKLDGTGPRRRSSTIRDDRGDSLSLAIKFFLKSADSADAEEMEKIREQEEAREMIRMQAERIYGPSHFYGVAEKPKEEQEPEFHHCWPKTKPGTEWKGFGYMREKPVR
jgi:hypothetical protein